MLDAFKPRTITRDIRGVAVEARSMTIEEAVTHQERVQAGDEKACLMAGMVARLCTTGGAPLFADAAEAMQADSGVIGELAELCMEANGDKVEGANVPLP